MSADAPIRARLRAAATSCAGLSAPTKQVDVYVRESAALCAFGAQRSDVLRKVQQRMALPLLEDTAEVAVFGIEQSTKYNQLKVYFKDEQVVSHILERDGSEQK